VQIGNSASGTLVLLTLACGEYAMKQSSVTEWDRRFKEGREDVLRTREMGSQKRKAQGTNLGALGSRFG
jgi:hypothetical protein